MTGRAAVAIAAFVMILVLGTAGWPAREYRHGDHFQFWAGGRALMARASPYDLAWWTDFHAREGSRATAVWPQPEEGPAWTTPYPLWTFAFFLPFALVPYDHAAAAWLVLQIVAGAGALAALCRALFADPRRDGLLLFGLVAGSQPAWLLLGGGNVTGFLLGALAGGLAALLARRPYLAGLLFGLLALKPHSFALIPVVLMLAAPGRWRVAAGALTSLVALLAVSLALRPGWPAEWVTQVAALQSSNGSNATALTLDRAVALPFVVPITVAALLGTFAAWWHVARPRFAVLFAGGVAVSLAVAPHGWSYDQLHLAVVVAVMIGLLATVPRGRVAGLVGLVVIAVAVPWALYVPSFGRNGEELTAFVPVLSFACLVALDRWVTRVSSLADPRARAVPAGTAADA